MLLFQEQLLHAPYLLFLYERRQNTEMRIYINKCCNKTFILKHAFNFNYWLANTVNALFNDTRYNSKICYNINSVCTKSADPLLLH